MLTRDTGSLALGLSAVALGVIGEALLFQESRRGVGTALLLGAMLLAGAAWGPKRSTEYRVPSTESFTDHSVLGTRHSALDSAAGRRELLLRLAGIAVVLLLAWGSVLAWLASPDEVFGLQGVLWLASIALFVASCARWRLPGHVEPGPRWGRAETAVLGGLTALALFTYLTNLDDIPWRFHYDEAIAYEEAMRFYRGPPISLFTTTWHETSLPSLWFAFAGSLMHLGGTGLGGVRLPVALIGALTVIPVYGLGRLLGGRVAAALAGFAVATSPVAIHYSRVSIINMTTPFFWAVCFYFLLKGLRSRRPADFAMSGLAAGLSMYTYYGTRLLPYLLLLFGVYLALFHFHTFRRHLGRLALVPVGFIVGFGPLLAYFIRNPDEWASRGLASLNVPAAIPSTWEGWAVSWNVLAPLARLNFLGLSAISSRDNVYFAPFMQPAEALLLVLGVGVLLWRWRQPAAFLVLAWGLGVLFVGGTLVDAVHVPAFAHWTPAFPAFFLAMALPLAAWLTSLRRVDRRWWVAGCGMLAGGMAALAAVNAYLYLWAYPAQVPPSFEAAQGRLLETLGPQHRVKFVGNSWQSFYSVIGEMMAPDVDASDLLNPSRSLPLIPDERDLLFVFHNDQTQYLPLVQSYYPEGKWGPIETPGGPIADTYYVTGEQTMSRHGVLLTLQDEVGSELWQGPVLRVGALPNNVQVAYPVTATWSGAFFMREAGPHWLSVEGSQAAIRVQGEQAPDAPVQLDAGWIPFSVEARLGEPAALRLVARQGSGPAEEISIGHLWPQRVDAGLVVTLKGAAITRRIDPFVGSSQLGTNADQPDALNPLLAKRDPDFIPLASFGSGASELIRWEGEVYAEGGQYEMELRTDARARLHIDGSIVLDLCDNEPLPGSIYRPSGHLFYRGGYPPVEAQVNLTQGWHHVWLDLHATGNTNGLEWMWTRPDGVRETVPPSRLRHRSAAGAPQHRWPDPLGGITCTP